MNVPKLRFKEFTDEWKNIKLQKIISIYKEQSTIENQYPMLTSSKQGLVLQKDYYSNNARITNRSNIGYNVLPYGYITYRNRSDTGFFTFNINLKLKKGLISYFYPVFSLKNSNEYFLVNLLNTKYQFKMYAISEGTSQKVLSIANLKNLKVLYPSLEEQNKIANFLTTVDKKITNLENTITSLENQKKGLLQQIFSQKLRFKDKNGNNYPNWEKKKLEDIAIFLDNKRKPLEQSERIHGKYPYYGASGIIDYINDYIFDEELVLLSEDGANIIDRNYPICYIATGKYWVNNHAHVLKVKSQYVNKFICESLEQLNYTKYNTGTAQPKLNQDVCRKIILSIPCLEEQTKIANFLSTFDRKLENQKAQLEHWKQIKKGLLQQMFV
ncbi:restriction endonuclease subunit S [Megamonas funiformis]|uniref:restriction endonuclease subunit S n=1 Tax=Megamonas funiformis TaxID=437897 RepID=UPI003AF73964